MTILNTTCCVVGGGPAGMMAGYLLARAGIETIVIEKHADFFRDFRGDTVHPSTLQLMEELGILSEFLQVPHQEVKQLGIQIENQLFMLADFAHLKTKCKFLAFMPQWDFLNFIAAQAKTIKSFSLHMNTEAIDIIEENRRVVGIKARTPQGEMQIHSQLVIGADGRNSILRKVANLDVQDIGAPMDVLWLRLSRYNDDPKQTLGRIRGGLIFLMLNRQDYWQCGFVIKKGELENIKNKGIESFRQSILDVVPFFSDRINEIKSWDDIKLLTVKVDRLTKWYKDGLLCIGDCAHAMSPIGGVGINLAVQDAVAAVNILWKSLSQNNCTISDLAKVQKRRFYPIELVQSIQVFLQNHAVSRALSAKEIRPSVIFDLLNTIPWLRRIPGYLIGIGFQPEHIRSPNKH